MNETVANLGEMFNALVLLSWARAALYLTFGYLLAKYLSLIVSRLVTPHVSQHHQILLKRLVFYLVTSLFLVSALRELGFKLSVLIGAAGIVSVAVGFASQTSASNLISGLFLLGERPFEVGNIIAVDNIRGEVISVDLLSVKLRTADNLFVRIPNETIIKTIVTNISRFPIRRLDVLVGIAYKEDINKAREVLLEIADKHAACLDNPEPFCVATNFGASSVDLQFSVWTKQENFLVFKNSIFEKVKGAFDEHGIEIPFPHTSLYTGSDTKPFPVRIVDAHESLLSMSDSLVDAPIKDKG
jgi:small-conductance mechanosensitive channel